MNDIDKKQRIKERKQANRAYLKNLQRCVICGKQDAYTLSGRSACADCCEKRRQYKPPAESVTRAKEKGKKRYEERIHQGLCVACGKREAVSGRRKCSVCLAKDRERHKARSRKDGAIPRFLADGMHYCTLCRKPLTDENRVNGKKMCKDCYEKVCKALKKARTYNPRNSGFCKEQAAYWKSQKSV